MGEMDGIPAPAPLLPMRNDLAVDRTTLANERTFLAYVRTALQCLVGGLSLLRFFERPLAHALGYVFIPLGGVLFVAGFVVYFRRRARPARTGGVGAGTHGI
ncbi:MAG TPA: DUF202 domain-containing protein [Longimicrobiales bacterium]|nr:DUF202 domain-containing protein [Longimicrobiales bacterium]